MKKYTLHIILMFLLINIFIIGGLRAQMDITGEISVDYESYSYDRTFKETKDTITVIDTDSNDTTEVIDIITPRSTYTTRSISNHVINLSLRSPIVNNEFADFSGRTSIYGTYYDAKSREDGGFLDKANDYFSPNLHVYSGRLSLFPKRSYPTIFNISKSFNRAVRYESNNRSDTSMVAPGLQILRRYDNELQSRGVQFRMSPRSNIDFVSEYKWDESKITRNYDFDENRNIWVEFSVYDDDPTVNYHVVTVVNVLLDSVDIFIDNMFIVALSPSETLGKDTTLLLEKGDHWVEIYPHTSAKYNSFQFNTSVLGEQSWKIIYNPPATPNDLKQTLTSFSSNMVANISSKAINESRLEYSDMRETIQGMTSFITSFNNSFNYDFSRLNRLNMMTTYTKNRTQIDTLTPQTNSSLMNQTSLSIAKRKGLATSISHTVNSLKSLIPSGTGQRAIPHDTLKSLTNIFTGRVAFGWDKFNYKGDLKNTLTMLSDSLHYGLRPVDTILYDNDVSDSIPPDSIFNKRVTPGYRSNQFISDLTSKTKLGLWRIALEPQHQIKYSYGKQKNPDQNSNEWEHRYTLKGKLVKFAYIDEIKFKGEYGRRSRTTVSEGGQQSTTDTKNRYIIDLSMTKEFTKKYKMMFMTTYERESFDDSILYSSSPIEGGRHPLNKYSFKVDIKANPISDILINAGFSQISQSTSTWVIIDTLITDPNDISNYLFIDYTQNVIRRFSVSLITTIPFLKIPLKSFFMSESRQLSTVDKEKKSGQYIIIGATQVQTSLETKMTFRFRKMALTLTHMYKYENLRDEQYSYYELRGKISRQFAF